MGSKTNNRARKKRLGSRLAAEAADHGRNFLKPTVADIAALEVTYQERGALIDRNRLFGNLLSSTPLAFNLAAPWRMDPKLGSRTTSHHFQGESVERVCCVSRAFESDFAFTQGFNRAQPYRG
ncbi:hypothetical protein K3163_02385 [Qipengyuania sp. 1NDW9]|nr:hypothetical protein [Qipengyuania xiapuensis]MBX7492053.1 hypothetical protein [Qipengyuania xiapuensis]